MASALLASASATHDRLGGPGRWLLALPAQHVAGVQVLVRSLVSRTEPGVLDLAGGFTPAGFAAAASALGGVRRYTALVPTQLVRLLDAADQGDGDGVRELARFDAVLVGGAGTPPAVLERAAAAGVRVVTTYGASETSGGCVYDGVPLDGVRVRLGDGPDPSRVLLGGPTLARGYRGGGPGRRLRLRRRRGALVADTRTPGASTAGGCRCSGASTTPSSPVVSRCCRRPSRRSC